MEIWEKFVAVGWNGVVVMVQNSFRVQVKLSWTIPKHFNFLCVDRNKSQHIFCSTVLWNIMWRILPVILQAVISTVSTFSTKQWNIIWRVLPLHCRPPCVVVRRKTWNWINITDLGHNTHFCREIPRNSMVQVAQWLGN